METNSNKITKGLPAGRQGFTIIEVMIVLAIAGLILAIIFLAVPALQRNSRNNSRTSDAAHLAGLVNEYAANHAGTLPSTVGNGPNDLSLSGENWAIMAAPTSTNLRTDNQWGTLTTLNVNKGFTCNASTNTLSVQARAFSMTFLVETSGGTQQKCIQG
ncbi:MAG: prepilin-type N-terminal cleavage/methylation domain-containing protein [Candidatus Saccharimonadales bacterium]